MKRKAFFDRFNQQKKKKKKKKVQSTLSWLKATLLFLWSELFHGIIPFFKRKIHEKLGWNKCKFLWMPWRKELVMPKRNNYLFRKWFQKNKNVKSTKELFLENELLPKITKWGKNKKSWVFFPQRNKRQILTAMMLVFKKVQTSSKSRLKHLRKIFMHKIPHLSPLLTDIWKKKQQKTIDFWILTILSNNVVLVMRALPMQCNLDRNSLAECIPLKANNWIWIQSFPFPRPIAGISAMWNANSLDYDLNLAS